MHTSKELYEALMTKAWQHIDLDDTLALCKIISSVLVRLEALDVIPLGILLKYKVVNHFTRITELTAWLKQITDCVVDNTSLIESGLLLDPVGTQTSLDVFNTTVTSTVVPEKQCLAELNLRLSQLWLITRGQQSYYTRVLNPSLVHVYSYLMIYIRIIEDEQFQDESDIRRSRQTRLPNEQPIVEIDEDDTVRP